MDKMDGGAQNIVSEGKGVYGRSYPDLIRAYAIPQDFQGLEG